MKRAALFKSFADVAASRWAAELAHRMRMEARAQEVADAIVGTCESLAAFATEAEANDAAFCAALDAVAFECSTCGWWWRREEESELEDGACEGCAPQVEGGR